jgi:hypothetical protein
VGRASYGALHVLEGRPAGARAQRVPI